MMKRVAKSSLCICTALFLSLAACATHEQTGALTGAGVGAATGSALTRGSVVGTLLGAFIGAAVGAEIGRQMDEADRRHAAYALEHNPTNQPARWVNPDTGYEYTFTPTRTYQGGQGPCREFVMNALIGGQPEQVYGTACRQPDGSWQILQ